MLMLMQKIAREFVKDQPKYGKDHKEASTAELKPQRKCGRPSHPTIFILKPQLQTADILCTRTSGLVETSSLLEFY